MLRLFESLDFLVVASFASHRLGLVTHTPRFYRPSGQLRSPTVRLVWTGLGGVR